jgi:hypothetical protein
MRLAGLTLVILLGLGWLALAVAGGVEADPNKEYRLGPKEGPYMILIASFHGDGDDEATSAYGEARKLVYELRSRYHFNAYMFNRAEQEKAARDKQLQELHARFGDAKIKKVRVVNEWAVVIGNWPTHEEAERFLYGTIKERPARDKAPNERTVPKAKLPPPESVRKTSFFTVMPNGTKARTDDGREIAVETEEQNPFSRAWVIRNPLAGTDAALVAGQEEQAIAAKLNSYSLKNCPKTHTLVVMEFYYLVPEAQEKGASGFMSHLNPFSSDKDARLVLDRPAAAKAAVQFADALRARNLGHEVFLWPTNRKILVTVGGFSITPVQASADNTQFYALRNKLAGTKIGDVQLLETMYPMVVPRN